MKETIDKFKGLPTVENGFTAAHINVYTARHGMRAMSKWHFKRKPYSIGGAPLGK